ncbi:MAG TPA: HNH endonuclease signature motif containing protein [Candidatus Acidoferrum sp.]|nr:HNH endonuclease signature motif containing protein [Candidatus Acidoferrum sp.]
MKWLLSLLLSLLLLLAPSFAQRRGSSNSGSKSSHAHKSASSSHRHSHGHSKRSRAAKDAFMRQTGYPHGRKGYVIDHVIPLACGGADSPSNMQWQTVADAKAKDKWERNGCKK